MSLKEEDERTIKSQPVGSPERPPPKDGVFSRPNFAKTVNSLIGNIVKVKTKTGSTYEGVFTTFSSNFEVIVALSHEVEPNDPFYNKVNEDSIVFNSEDILSISCVNVNLEEALDLSQRLEIAGDFSGKRDPDDEQELNPYVDKGRNIKQHQILRPNDRDMGSDFGDLKGYPFYSRPSDFKEPKIPHNPDDYQGFTEAAAAQNLGTADPRGDYPKPQRKPKCTEGGPLISDDFSSPEVRHIEKSSGLNPYAKPFTPMEPARDKDSALNPSIQSLAAVVLPTYVVSNNTTDGGRYGKSDGQGLVGATPSLLGTGSLQNQYMPYSPYGGGYDEKLYSSYDNLPLSAHDYQQYYPHLQYIQYFRRFY